MTFLMSTLQIYVEIDVSAIWLIMKMDYKHNSKLLSFGETLIVFVSTIIAEIH